MIREIVLGNDSLAHIVLSATDLTGTVVTLKRWEK